MYTYVWYFTQHFIVVYFFNFQIFSRILTSSRFARKETYVRILKCKM